MNELGLYAVYDELTEQYSAPIMYLNDKVAVKSWQIFINTKKPEEIEGQYLCRIGTYNINSAELIRETEIMRLT